MKTSRYSRGLQAPFIGIAMVGSIAGSITIARADIKDYKFELVDQTVQVGRTKRRVYCPRRIPTTVDPHGSITVARNPGSVGVSAMEFTVPPASRSRAVIY